jgi:EpsI family protein
MTRFVRTVVVVLLVLGGAGAYSARAWRAAHALSPSDEAKIPARLARIPLRVGSPPFVGTRDTLDRRIVELSGADHYAAIDFRGESGPGVRLHVGVSVRSEGWLHEPTVCLPSQGWATIDTSLVPMWAGLAGVRPGVSIWRMRLEKAGRRLLVYYWFQWGDHIVTSRLDRAWQRLRGLLAGERDRPVQIVILYTPIEDGESEGAARVESLVRALWPELSTVLAAGD